MIRRRVYLFLIILAIWMLTSLSPLAQANDTRYYPGDWTGYTAQRLITSIAIAPERIYFGSWGGIVVYDRYLDQIERNYTTIEGLPSNRVISLAYDDDNFDLYVRTIAGDVILDPAGETFSSTDRFPEESELEWHTVDLLSFSLPIGYTVIEDSYITDDNLRDFMVWGEVRDDWGNVWVGTRGLGIWHGRVYDQSLEPLTSGLAHRNVRAIERIDHRWFFGGPRPEGEAAGLSILDTLTNEWEYIEARYTNRFISDEVLDLACTGDTLWIAGTRGLTRYCPQEDEPFRTYNEFSGLLSNYVTALATDEDVLWVGSDMGLNALLLAQDSVVRLTDQLSLGTYVFEIAVIDDFVWAGTDQGLVRMFRQTGEWRRFSWTGGILNGSVRAITADDTAFYFGTDQGLAIVWRDGSGVVEYSLGTVLPVTDIYDLAVTERIIWASTPAGLLRFDPKDETSRLITRDDGLFDDFVQVIYPDGDYLWLGTSEGVLRFFWNNPYRFD